MLCRPQDFMTSRGQPKTRYAHRGYSWFYHCHVEGSFNRVYCSIHYLTAHAPKNVQLRWEQARIRLHKRTRWHKAGINNKL